MFKYDYLVHMEVKSKYWLRDLSFHPILSKFWEITCIGVLQNMSEGEQNQRDFCQKIHPSLYA